MTDHRSLLVALVAACALVLGALPAFADAATLRAPSLEAPAAGATVQAPPTLTWRPVKGAARYDVQVAADRQFGSISLSARTRNTAATLKTTLIDGTYFWRVRAISAGRKVGRWSAPRDVVKSWSTAPELVRPIDDFGAVWPVAPLVLEWTPVPRATSYIVTVATDPSLAQPILGTVARPQTTQGTVFAFPGTLNAGTYYWQITPVDTDGHKGTPSRVGRFTWSWPSQLTPSVEDPNPAAEVFDPLLRWTAVPGAARYDIEVNTTPDFAPGSTFFKATTAGTAVSPTVPVPNNTYHWRVRAVDALDRAGAWATGTFRKEFDDASSFQPPRDTIPGLTLRDGTTDAVLPPGATTSSPIFTWAPVTGAAEYEVQVAPKNGEVCDWAARVLIQNGFTDRGYTRNAFFDPRVKASSDATGPGAASWPRHSRLVSPFVDGQAYCMRLLARDGAGARNDDNRNDSEFTYLGGTSATNTVAFVYDAPVVPADAPCTVLPQPTYLTPERTARVASTPRFRWSPVAGAKSYYVVVARDEAFTEVVEVALVDQPYYLPATTDREPGANRDTYEDEQTSYYWAVYPSARSTGTCFSQRQPGDPSYPAFDKSSVPPTPTGPADGIVQSEQPVFTWHSAEGAADYRVQVARDAEFRDVIDDVVTASTAYATTKSYPVDTNLYWRVRGRDANSIELNWSAPRSFRRTLPTPSVAGDNPVTGSSIPLLSWNPVPGAVSYDFHVDRVDGRSQDFTVATPRFTPTEFYGNGIWKWRVRANFPAASSQTVSGAYGPTQDYVRRLLPPENTKAVRTGSRVVFSWNPDRSGKKYRLEVSEDDSFTDKIESVITPNTSYAPLLEGKYESGGRLYWRVAIQDSGNNLGAWSRGDLRLPPKLQLKTKVRSLRRGRTTTLVVTVTDPRGTKMRRTRVRVSGAGVRTVSRRTGTKGTVRFRVRPRRRGTVKLTATRTGYVAGALSLRAG